MVSPPSTGSDSDSDLDNQRLDDSASANPGIISSPLHDDLATS